MQFFPDPKITASLLYVPFIPIAGFLLSVHIKTKYRRKVHLKPPV